MIVLYECKDLLFAQVVRTCHNQKEHHDYGEEIIQYMHILSFRSVLYDMVDYCAIRQAFP